MLDKLTKYVLDKINAASDGSYKVMDAEDFLSALPARMTADENGVSNAVKYLSERGYVDLKYADNGTYCVCSMPKGRQYVETARVSDTDASRIKRSFFAAACAGGLFGALIGGALVALIIAFLV